MDGGLYLRKMTDLRGHFEGQLLLNGLLDPGISDVDERGREDRQVLDETIPDVPDVHGRPLFIHSGPTLGDDSATRPASRGQPV